MDAQERRFILNNIYNCWHIRVFLYEDDTLTECVTDAPEAGARLLPAPDELAQIRSGLDGGRPVMVWTDAKLYFAAFQSGPQMYVLGPMAETPLSPGERHAYMEGHGCPVRFEVPVISQMKAPAVLALICFLLTGAQFTEEQLTGHPSGQNTVAAGEMDNYNYSTYLQSMEHMPYQTESDWLDSIENGTYRTAEQYFTPDNMNKLAGMGVMAHTSAKQLEYMTVSSIALACRAAIRGGADPMEMYSLANLYLQKTEQASRETEYLYIADEANYDFSLQALKAKEQQRENGSLVEQCKEYIAHNRSEHLSVQDIADALHVSRSYLSTLFRQKTGMTIRQYISQQRLDTARNLLKFSDAPVREISDYLQFSSQSHFTRFFSQETGMTPSKYRSLYQVKDLSGT